MDFVGLRTSALAKEQEYKLSGFEAPLNSLTALTVVAHTVSSRNCDGEIMVKRVEMDHHMV